MPPEVRKRIFEPFLTTKDFTGTGLGLWVSSEIILKHHGTVRVRSHAENPGSPSGTIFELFLPNELAPPQNPNPKPPRRGCSLPETCCRWADFVLPLRGLVSF